MPGEDLLRERRRAHRLARRLIRFLEKAHDWEIRFVPLRSDLQLLRRLGFDEPIVGALIWDQQRICIDPSFKDFFAVLIHECLHAIYPFKDERDILDLEDLVRRHLTPRQAKHLLVWTANRLR